MAGKSSVIKLTKKDGESKWKNLNAGLLIIAFLAALLVLVPAAGWGGETVSDDFDDSVLDNMWYELDSTGIEASEENQRLEFRTNDNLEDDNGTRVSLNEFIKTSQDFRARVDFNSQDCTADAMVGMMVANAETDEDTIDECITLANGNDSRYDETQGNYWIAESFAGDEEKVKTAATDEYTGTLYVEYKDQTVYLSYRGFDPETAFASYDIGEEWTDIILGLAAWSKEPELSGEGSYFDNFKLEYANTDGEYETLTETKLSDLSEKYNWLWFRPTEETPLDVDLGIDADSRMSFDTDGNWSFAEYEGSYSIDDEDGYLTMTDDQEGTLTSYGTLSLADDLLIIPTKIGDPGISIAMKPVSEPENIDLSGRRYNYTDIVVGPEGLKNSAGYFEFDENSVTMYEEYNSREGDQADYEYGPFDYSINDQGFLEIYVDTDEDTSTKLGLISPDENIIVTTAKVEEPEEVLFMVRADKTPGVEDLSGKYNLTEWEVLYDEDGELRTDEGQLICDGNGNWEYPDVEESGTYDIDENGRLVREDETFGPVSSDGNLIIKPETDSGEVGIGIGTKTVASVGEVGATDEDGNQGDVTDSENTILTSSQLEENFGLTGFEPVGEVSRVSVDVGDYSADDDLAVMTLSYDISGLSGTAGDYKLMKLIGDDLYRKFDYAEEGNSEDGDWWLETNVGTYVSPEDNLENSDDYTVFFKVKDNGKFDLDDEPGVIEDPTVLGTESESTDDGGTDDGSTDDGGGGGGSSGCFINSLMR